jgi:hypothetical protein
MIASTIQRSEELSVGPARLRVDVLANHPIEHVLADQAFLDYRLAEVLVQSSAVLAEPDIVWDLEGPRSIAYDGRRLALGGDWPAGPIQKIIVAMLALRMEAVGLHPFHASAVRYRDRTIVFLGGESNHGKSMGQIEACRRGAALIATETTVIDEAGRAVLGSQEPFLRKRTEGTERADKAGPEQAVERFFGELPSWDRYPEPSDVDLVVVPAIDGNFAPAATALIPFERQFQAFHSVQNYILLNELLAPGFPMPVLDTDALRATRADFIRRFAERPFHLVRAATPHVLLDQVEQVM